MFFSKANRIWTAYASILLLAAALLAGLSWFTVKLDRDAEKNRRGVLVAEQETAQRQRISSALWRMDTALSPLVAQEAARTHWMYQSFLPDGNDQGDSSQRPSPLLARTSPWVLLHFQVSSDGQVTSPQSPKGDNRQLALGCGISEQELLDNQARLNEVASAFRFDQLWFTCSPAIPSGLDTGDPWRSYTPLENTRFHRGNLAQQSQSPELVDSGMNQVATLQSMLPGASVDRAWASDYLQRGQTANSIATQQRLANQHHSPFAPTATASEIVEGAIRPVWLDDRLVMIRRVPSLQGDCVQGCWLDWSAIKEALLIEIEDIFPEADLIARGGDDPKLAASLATLPIDLIVPTPDVSAGGLLSSSSRAGWLLAVTWGCFLVAAACIGWMIWGITQLSDRRAAFASAVTHELRTPLTTFRLYSEMLAGEMIQTPSQRQQYTLGLLRESDRLCRLVDNVLQFARLERRQFQYQRQTITIEQLLQNATERSRRRAESDNVPWELRIEPEIANRSIQTSVDLIDQILFNLVDNACKYACQEGSKPMIQMTAKVEGKWLVVNIRDYGPGMDARLVKRLFRPFSRSSDETAGTAAGVGIGLSLSRQLAKQVGGRLEFHPAQPGCRFELRLPIQ